MTLTKILLIAFFIGLGLIGAYVGIAFFILSLIRS